MVQTASYVLRYIKAESAAWQEKPFTQSDLLIGRTADCDVQLDNPEVSRYHANLKIADDGVWLMDMGSTNGTQLEGEPLAPNRRVILQLGQQFSIGPYTLIVEALTQAVPAEEMTVIGMPKVKRPTYDVEALRQAEFPAMLDMVYLNNASLAPLPVRTRDRMIWAAEQFAADPAAQFGPVAGELFGKFMSGLAQFIHAESASEIVVVDSVSSAVNAIAQAVPLIHGDNVVLCNVEFPANVYPWMSRKWDGAVVREVEPVHGGLTLEAVENSVNQRTKVVAVSSVQFFTGHRTDLAAIGRFCRERNIIFVVDAIQSVGHAPIDVQAMGIDILISGGHKSMMSGPGVGFMYVRDAICEALRPRLISATSTHNWEFYLDYDITPEKGAWRFFSGTPNLAGMHAMVESIGLINELTREAIEHHTTSLAGYAIETARRAGYEVVTERGEHGSIMCFKSGVDNLQSDAVVQALGEQNVKITKHLDKQGVPHYRLSFHCYNTRADVDRCFEALQNA